MLGGGHGGEHLPPPVPPFLPPVPFFEWSPAFFLLTWLCYFLSRPL